MCASSRATRKNSLATIPGSWQQLPRSAPKTRFSTVRLWLLDQDGPAVVPGITTPARGAGAIAFYAFDLLSLNGRELLSRPLEQRRRALAKAVKQSDVLLSEPLEGTVQQLERAIRRHGLEGIVAKRRDSSYRPGQRTDAWIKVKFSAQQEFVVGGFKPGGPNFDSILVGYYEGKQL